MPDNPLTLNVQLACRVKTFCANMGLSQRDLCKFLRLDETQFSRWLNGQCNFSAETTLKIYQLINLSMRDLQLKFGKPEKTTARIMHLQEAGQPMRLDDSGWIAKEGGSDDPNDTTGIDNTWKEGGEPCGDDIIDCLRQVDNYHRQAREAIAAWFANYQKAKPNAKGVSEGPRKIADNTTSKTPGPKGDLFGNSTEQLKRRLEFSRKMREEAEEKLRLQQEIDEEKRRWWAAKSAT